MRDEERDGCVAPIVDQSGRAILGIELKDREQLDRSDAELLEVGDFCNQAGVSATQFLDETRAGMTREAANVRLVDDCPRIRTFQRRVAFPVVGRAIDDDAFHRRGCIVTRAASRVATVAFWHRHAPAIRIAQDFFRIKPHSARSVAFSLRPVSVNLTRLHGRNWHFNLVL